MSRYAEESPELIELLNQWDASRITGEGGWQGRAAPPNVPRRKPHHLPREYYAGEERVYFVTLCARHHPLPFADADFAQEVINSFMFYRNRGDYALYAYCLMPDHLHCLLQLLGKTAEPRPDPVVDGKPIPHALAAAIGRFKSYTTHQAWKRGLHGKLWQRDYYDHILRHPKAMEGITQYILTDPIRSGICRRLGEYLYAGTPDAW
jgi:REP element-mobilizing transposase RayT